MVLGVLAFPSVRSLSLECCSCLCGSFGLVHRHVVVLREPPFLGPEFELPLLLVLLVVVVVVLNVSVELLVRFVSAYCL